MNNIEICKRIAEIEGEYKNVTDRRDRYNEYLVHVQDKAEFTRWFNPLTDDALCFRLMVKYDLDLMSPYRKDGCTQWEAQIFHCNYSGVVSIYDESPNKAICLAIIEVN